MRALLGVYDKTGIIEFARGLHELGWELVSTGGTFATIEAAGIPTLALKGAALIHSLYSDLGQRPMNDLDILVPAGRAAEAAEVLRAEGYSWAGPTDLATALAFENELEVEGQPPRL